MVCTFFGHRDDYGLDIKLLYKTIERLIEDGVDTFYVGNQGHFDRMVLGCLIRLKENHKHISPMVVLAYLPTQRVQENLYHEYSVYPEEVEMGPPRFAINRRNNWMIDKADYCLCYVRHARGGAYTFALRAKRKGLTVINLGGLEF